MTISGWLAALAGFTMLMMLIEHLAGRRENRPPNPVSHPVHYGHSDVPDHEYEDLHPHWDKRTQ